MKTTFKIYITIDSKINGDISNETKIVKMIFSDFSDLFDYLDIMENLKTALKINKNYQMLTVDFLINENLESSFRVINQYGEIKGCKSNFGKYDNFEVIDKKEINNQIKYIIELANKKFIEFIKK